MRLRNLPDINLAVVHCSDSPDSRDVGAQEIRNWHLQRGFSDIGYHFVIRRDGVIEDGRQICYDGAHVREHNKNSIGICLVGKKTFSKAQAEALIRLYEKLYHKFGLTIKNWSVHNEFDPGKTCPNFSKDYLTKFLEVNLERNRGKGRAAKISASDNDRGANWLD